MVYGLHLLHPPSNYVGIFRLPYYAPPDVRTYTSIYTASYSTRQEFIFISNAARATILQGRKFIPVLDHTPRRRPGKLELGSTRLPRHQTGYAVTMTLWPSPGTSGGLNEAAKERNSWFYIPLPLFFWLPETRRNNSMMNMRSRLYTPDSFKPNEVFCHNTLRNANS